jgi:hypothetical protein
VVLSWHLQVFGPFSGQVILEHGMIQLIENLPGLAEKVKNRW